jgi:hypothetical protein
MDGWKEGWMGDSERERIDGGGWVVVVEVEVVGSQLWW